MNINQIIDVEAPNNTIHDKAYKEALLGAYDVYKDMSLEELKEWQTIARKQYDSTHNKVAACVILYELIKEKVNG